MVEVEIRGVRQMVDSARMKRRTGHVENFDEDGVLHDSHDFVEWWLDGECVHRSVSLVIHRMPPETATVLGLIVGNKEKEMEA